MNNEFEIKTKRASEVEVGDMVHIYGGMDLRSESDMDTGSIFEVAGTEFWEDDPDFGSCYFFFSCNGDTAIVKATEVIPAI